MSDDRTATQAILKAHNFDSDATYGKTKIFIQNAQTVFELERIRDSKIPGAIFIIIQSSVKTLLQGSENNPQNIPLPAPNMHYCAMVQHFSEPLPKPRRNVYLHNSPSSPLKHFMVYRICPRRFRAGDLHPKVGSGRPRQEVGQEDEGCVQDRALLQEGQVPEADPRPRVQLQVSNGMKNLIDGLHPELFLND